MMLLGTALACVLTLGSFSHVGAASLRRKQFLEAAPAPVSNRSTQGGQSVAGRLSRTCEEEHIFEDALDRLAFQLFVNPPANASQDTNFFNQTLHAVAFSGAQASLKDVDAVHFQAAATRLQSWWDAVTRAQRNESQGLHLADDRTKRKKGKIVHGSFPLSPLGTDLNRTAPVKKEKKADEKTNAVSQDSSVLPTACASALPAHDPYWSQIDSYQVCKAGKCDNYNECRYSNGCTRQFTNGERVASIRASLGATKQLLERYGVMHMLFGGSVIGAYRCQDVLPWDLDADVAVLNEHIPLLMNLLTGVYGTGFRNMGRSVDMAPFGIPGFILMEKHAGCMPLVVVDKSTGFFTDIWPMQPVFSDMYSPWGHGRIACNGPNLFNGCEVQRCDFWSLKSTLPPSVCQVHTLQHYCAHDLRGFLYEYYGPSVDHPDRPTRR